MNPSTKRPASDRTSEVFAAIFDASQEAQLITDEDGVIEFANRSAAELFGYETHELIGRGVSMLVPPNRRHAHRDHIAWYRRQARQDQTRSRRLVQAWHADGTEFTVTVDLSPLDAASGSRILVRIVDLERWAETLGTSDFAFDASPIPMCFASMDGGVERSIRSPNQAMCAFLGYPREELEGRSFRTLTFPEDAAEDDAAAQRFFAGTQTSLVRRKRYRHHDGHVVWGELHSRILPQSPSRRIALVHIVDIGDRVRLEQAQEHRAVELEQAIAERTAELAAREARLRLVLEATTTGTWEWDIDADSVAFSDAWLTSLGYAPGDLVGGPWRWESIIHPADWPDAEHRLTEHLRGRNEFCECTARMRRADGTWRWSRTRGKVVERDEDGRPVRMIGATTDISQRRVLEDQLVHAAKMQALGAFAGGIAHDFNNVLAIVTGHVELLSSETEVSPAMQARLERIQRAVDRAAGLVKQLMLLGRPATDNPVPIDVGAFIERLAGTLRSLLREDITMEVELPSVPSVVRIDLSRLEAVLLNLVGNASDAMPEGGTLRIRVARIGDLAGVGEAAAPHLVRLEVTDDGVGMDAATRELAFEPFFTTKSPGVGTGLGLATTYSSIVGAGGSIDAESTLGQGTTIRIDLPAVDAATVDAVPRGAARHAPDRIIDATILVVEDEAELVELTADILRSDGYRVFTALGGHEALEILSEVEDIDLLVTDVVMPDMSGGELATRARAMRPRLEVLFLSGYAEPSDDAIDPARLLTKPIAELELVEAVGRALAAKRS